jgi:hypothetical protein
VSFTNLSLNLNTYIFVCQSWPHQYTRHLSCFKNKVTLTLLWWEIVLLALNLGGHEAMQFRKLGERMHVSSLSLSLCQCSTFKAVTMPWLPPRRRKHRETPQRDTETPSPKPDVWLSMTLGIPAQPLSGAMTSSHWVLSKWWFMSKINVLLSFEPLSVGEVCTVFIQLIYTKSFYTIGIIKGFPWH